MKHKKCGGKFMKIKQEESETMYQCNRCNAVRTVYKRTATGGNPKHTAGMIRKKEVKK